MRWTPPAPLRSTEPVPEQAGGDPLSRLILRRHDGMFYRPIPGGSLPLQPPASVWEPDYYMAYLMKSDEVSHLIPYGWVPDCPGLRASVAPARLYVTSDGQLSAELLHMPTRSHREETNA